MNAIAKSALIAVAVLLLGSCLNAETRIDLNNDNSGRITVSYEIDPELWELGVFDAESSVRAIPVSEPDFRRTARRIDGVELLSYSRSAGEDRVDIEAELSFADLSALNEVYAPGQGLISVAEENGARVYRQELRTGEEFRPGDEEFLRTYFSDYQVAFEVEVPDEILTSNIGIFLANRRGVRVSLGIVEFLTGDGPLVWEIRY